MKKNEELLKRDDRIPLDSCVFLKNISFSYETNKDVLNNISFDIKKGEFVSFIGRNGSGKSTLAKLIDGILIQNSGDIFINGVLVDDKNALLLRKEIGIVFQNPDSQFIGATVRDDIAFCLENLCIHISKMNEIIEDVADKVNMSKYLDYPPESLSGGQKQRIAIAGAICKRPNILILDEATAMLDPKGRNEIEDIILKMRKENNELTIINITHMIEEANKSDRIIVLDKGKIVADDTPTNIFDNVELLSKVKLDIPFAKKLNIELKKENIDIKEVHSEKEIIDRLCQLK